MWKEEVEERVFTSWKKEECWSLELASSALRRSCFHGADDEAISPLTNLRTCQLIMPPRRAPPDSDLYGPMACLGIQYLVIFIDIFFGHFLLSFLFFLFFFKKKKRDYRSIHRGSLLWIFKSEAFNNICCPRGFLDVAKGVKFSTSWKLVELLGRVYLSMYST